MAGNPAIHVSISVKLSPIASRLRQFVTGLIIRVQIVRSILCGRKGEYNVSLSPSLVFCTISVGDSNVIVPAPSHVPRQDLTPRWPSAMNVFVKILNFPSSTGLCPELDEVEVAIGAPSDVPNMGPFPIVCWSVIT